MATPKISTASNSSAVPSTAYTTASAYSPARLEVATRNRLPLLFGIAVLLSSTALAISGYLSYVAFTSSKIVGCGGGMFDCDHVLHSQWSTMLGLPVAAWASSMYLGVLAALLFSARAAVSPVPSALRQWTWFIVTTAAVSAGLAALWFTGLQVFVLEHLCPWCLGAHTCGLLLCISTLVLSPLPAKVKGLGASLGFTGTLGLVVIQLMTPAPPTFTIEEFPAAPAVEGGVVEEPEMFDAPGEGDEVFMAPDTDTSSLAKPALQFTRSLAWAQPLVVWLSQPASLLVSQVALAGPNQQAGNQQAGKQDGQPPAQEKPKDEEKAEKPAERLVHLSGANIKLRVKQWPLIGSPDAKYVFVELFDYTCSHCRATQKAIKGAQAHFKDDLAIVVMAVPLSRQCNDTVASDNASHRESCEISQIALALWKVNPEKYPELHEWLLTTSPIPTAAAARAKAIQLVDANALAGQMDNAAKFIRSHVDIYRRMKAGPVPKLIFANTVSTGEMTS
ncbi:MAG: thioredoxin domain-containing protein, partial [Pirellulaceae bacterium]|nr:thioredoxin domain-containing protein [Pirellulaceae bacterium]